MEAFSSPKMILRRENCMLGPNFAYKCLVARDIESGFPEMIANCSNQQDFTPKTSMTWQTTLEILRPEARIYKVTTRNLRAIHFLMVG